MLETAPGPNDQTYLHWNIRNKDALPKAQTHDDENKTTSNNLNRTPLRPTQRVQHINHFESLL